MRQIAAEDTLQVFVGLRPHAYRVILVDPALKFRAGPSRNPERHYRTSPIERRCDLPVGELAHPDGARLFLWMTMPHLHHVPQLLAAWGFRYCTARPWLKLWRREQDALLFFPDSFAVGTGYEVRNSAELQVIAKRGRPQRLNGTKFHGHIIAARREHSRKPDCVRDELARLLDGPRCELFARSTHPDFEAWGDEINHFRRERDTP